VSSIQSSTTISSTIGTPVEPWDTFVYALTAGSGGGSPFVPYNPWPQIGPMVAQ
jgi:hypothetical protein